MCKGHGRSVLLVCLLFSFCRCAFALDPSLDVSQYAHTAWKIRDGFAKGTIISIAQTPDGYLWLGTEFGLLRFDGVRAVPWQPAGGEQLLSSLISKLLVSRDGTLWIGAWKGLASWRDGKLTQYPELAGQTTYALLEDREGTLWVGAGGIPAGGLCSIRNGAARCQGWDGTFGRGATHLYEDGKGTLWVAVHDGLWRWKPGPPQFYSLPGEKNGIGGLAEDVDGALLIGMGGGIRRFIDGKTQKYRLSRNVATFQTGKLLRDRDGGLWVGTLERGVVHVHGGRTDEFELSDGLSGKDVTALFEDREGSIWVSTHGGLDRFRDFAVATFTGKQGLSDGIAASVFADRDGSVWLSTYEGLYRWDHGRIARYDKGGGKLNGEAPNSLFQDSRGRIWVSTHREFGYLDNDRFVAIPGIPGGPVNGIAEDAAGTLWIASYNNGLLHLVGETVAEQIPWAKLGHEDAPLALATDPRHGGLWLGFFKGGVVHFRDGQVDASYSTVDGLGDGWVTRFRFDPDGTIWIGTQGGLSRLKNGRIATLASKNGLPCDAVHWVIRDNDQSFWLKMPCGLVRVTRPEINAWAAAVDEDKNTKRTIQGTVFDSFDGVRNQALASGYTPHVTRSSDGRLWFTNYDGVSVIDPRHLPFNRIPPPVDVEQMTADRKTYDATSNATGRLRLPPLIRDLQIDYTALSLAVPEKVRFRYKLEGWDRDWQDVGNRRQAFYSNLPPRNYRFRVAACNNSGVWNETGAFVDFSVAPAYYQAWWFRLSCVAAFLALLWAIYQMRLRQVAKEFNLRMEERVNERTRIARELHDTLLQSFQGVLLFFQAASDKFATRPAEAKVALDRAIDKAAQAVTEGRHAIQGLRSSTTETNSLAASLNALGEELAANPNNHHSPVVDVQVEGAPRELHPILRDDVFRIAGEALRNAVLHARASKVDVGIRYGPQGLEVRIRDDGKGIDPQVLQDKGRAGHWGLRGMHERAKLVGGKLEVWSKIDSGTEIQLSIPASAAYDSARTRRFRWFSRTRSFPGKEQR